PPADRTASEPNCAAPENTTIDMTIGATAPIVGRASTPNETAIANTATPNVAPRRIPARRRSLASGLGAAHRIAPVPVTRARGHPLGQTGAGGPDPPARGGRCFVGGDGPRRVEPPGGLDGQPRGGRGPPGRPN